MIPYHQLLAIAMENQKRMTKLKCRMCSTRQVLLCTASGVSVGQRPKSDDDAWNRLLMCTNKACTGDKKG
jgi:hypothetical protein